MDQPDSGSVTQDDAWLYKEWLQSLTAGAFFLISQECRILSANTGVKQLFGYEQHELEGHPVSILFTPEDVDAGIPELEMIRAQHEGCIVNERWQKRKDGTRLYCWITTAVLRGPENAVNFARFVHDATAHWHTNEAIQDLQQRYELALKAANDAVWYWDLTSDRLYWNPGVETLFGYRLPEVETTFEWWKERVHEADRSRAVESIEKALRSGADHWSDEYRFRRADGTYAYVLDRGFVQHDEEGHAMRAVGSMQDISGRIAAEEELQVLNAALRRSNEELQQFAYIASHDLQEPLRMIRSYAQLITDRYASRLGEDGAEFLDYLMKGVDRMQALITGLLTYSRVDTHHQEVSLVDMNAALAGGVQALSIAIEESGAIIRPQKLPTVPGRPLQLIQVFQNLISNAIKYRSAQPLVIDIFAEEREDSWEFSVSDNGIGIAPEHHERIFILFKRLHGRDVPGTGLGLALCRRIIERHGGRIWVESEVGKGATFRFLLPKYMHEDS